jgi:predicted Zn-dependent protease
LEAAAEAMLKNYQLTLVESKRDDVNGLPVIAMIADQVSQEPQQHLRTLIHVIEHGKNIYAMIGVSSISLFNASAPTLKASIETFAALNDPEKINKQPERIRVKAVQQNGSLAEALKSYRTKEDRLEEVAILNGMKLTDAVDKGMLIKIID